MVAPTRTPQARGVKCNLCKKILTLATWLDQTKLAKNIEDPRSVLNLIKQHDLTDCNCIPSSIQNLLVGSTHFEIHRLLIKKLDLTVQKKQYELYLDSKQNYSNEQSKKTFNINDCNDLYYQNRSRFKPYVVHNDQKTQNLIGQQLEHLSKSIDFWKISLEDQVDPFNSKLALRLGLTHHVIYACYLYKYYKILDYQMITANLLLNLFKSIEGVTGYAIIHANYILIRTLIDCNQLHKAKEFIKQATKSSNYQDKSHYESILLACVSCEINLLESKNSSNALEELAELAIIKQDDKLQHYYARTLALSTVIRYIHYHRTRSELCFEYYHTFRYLSAIIRRCYDNCFELVLLEKEINNNKQQQINSKQLKEQSQNQILDHSWIRYAVCDFVFNTFALVSKFFIRSGQPEAIELLYNGLNLVAHRSGCYFWQSKMATIGIDLDLLCDKYEQAKAKIDILETIKGEESKNTYLMNLLDLHASISANKFLQQKDTVIKIDVVMDLLERIRACYKSFSDRISQIELYDCKSKSYTKLDNNLKLDSNFINNENSYIKLGSNLGELSLKVLEMSIVSMLRGDYIASAQDLMKNLSNQLRHSNEHLEYYDCQTLLDILLRFAEVEKSEQILLESIKNSQLFFELYDNNLETQFSTLTLDSEKSCTSGLNSTKCRTKMKQKFSRMSIRRGRKGTYNVASKSEENLSDCQSVRLFDTIEAVKNFNSLTKEEIVVAYLRNSEPNPDYSLYRRAHELMFCFRLKDESFRNQDHLLYHFCESNTTNTMRYRWMMFEEQQASPFEPPKKPIGHNKMTNDQTTLRYLAFKDIMVNSDKILKSMVQSIPNDSRLIQLKYILDYEKRKEHILIACFDSKNDPFYVHVERPITSDDFFKDASDMEAKEVLVSSLPMKIQSQIDEAKKSLFIKNQRDRSEKRRFIEKQLDILLNNFENDWLGPFRILFIGGKLQDSAYEKFTQDIKNNFIELMERKYKHSCESETALKLMLENCPCLSREEFFQLLSCLFNCSTTSDEVKECFNFWLKSFESYLELKGINKDLYFATLNRGQLGIILDKTFELLPLESMRTVRITKQGIFRVPSLRLLNVIATKITTRINPENTLYVLDPANNLAKTRERFETKLKANNSWSGTISEPPCNEQFERWLMEKDVYIFIGHGAGTAYYNKLCKGRGLSSMPTVKSMAIVMGCSSGRVSAEGPHLESFGISWVFIFRGSPAYVGLLWDVTDTDIDKFLDSLLDNWMRSFWNKQIINGSGGDKISIRQEDFKRSVPITNAIAVARQVCEYKLLIGSTPVIYGLPVSC